MSQQVVARDIARRTARRLVDAARVGTTVHFNGTSEWTLNYGGALYISIAQIGERIAVRYTAIPKKCNPNFRLAASQDVDAALLWATKQIFGIRDTN